MTDLEQRGLEFLFIILAGVAVLIWVYRSHLR